MRYLRMRISRPPFRIRFSPCSPCDPMTADYYLGLDLGQAGEFTALAVVERPPAPPDEPAVYVLPHLRRFPVGTPFAQIVSVVAALATGSPVAGSATLVVGQTGVGGAVVSLLRRVPVQARVIPVVVTTGQMVTQT